ncbi:MAG: prephenate dehydratase [Acholeplasmataceae bacterium]
MKRIALLGPEGTFSDLAYRAYKDRTMVAVYQKTIRDCFTALTNDEADLAIVPIENTIDGYVQQTLDLLIDSDLFVSKELRVPIAFSLIAHAKDESEIARLYVQFVAHGQCQKAIDALPTREIILTANNQDSRRLVQKSGDAGIVPSHLVDGFNGFIRHGVADIRDNHTRFVVLTKRNDRTTLARVKIAVVVFPEVDRPGLLFDMLAIFKRHRINLISIMSRPTRTGLGNYHFFIEMQGQNNVESALEEIGKSFHLRILGAYGAHE